MTIFLSYARNDDEPFVKQLYHDLTARGFDVWWDRVKMPSRALTFLQEIRDAIDSCERLILVVGPSAVQSDYVRAEWQYARHACKVINPILRLGDYDTVPREFSLLHTPDMRTARPYQDALAELVRILAEPIPPLGELRDVPSLPSHFLPRPEQMEHLSDVLLADVNTPTIITSAKQTAALQGMGGIGKSVMAAAFARLCETRRAFRDGVIWLTIGREPNLLTNLQKIGRAFNDAFDEYPEVERARTRLYKLLADKNCLIVLDDVWEVTDAEPFKNALGTNCRLLITTRDGGLVTALGAQEHRLDVLSPEASLTLLAETSGINKTELPSETNEVAKECGYLPFALSIAGAMAHDGTPWGDLLTALQNADISFLETQFPNYPYPDVLKAIKVSVDALGTKDPAWEKHYKELGVFPKTFAVPEAAIIRLWVHTNGLNEYRARQLLTTLGSKSLLRLEGTAPERKVSLHDLHHDYLRATLHDLTGLHEELLAAYREKCPEGWHTGPNDGYFFQRLLYHLEQAGHQDVVRQLLLDYLWLQAKLDATDINVLMSDYEPPIVLRVNQSAERARLLSLVQGALQLSAHVLGRDKSQLASQLTGRLLALDEIEVRSFLDDINEKKIDGWLRPLSAFLAPPGGPLVRSFNGWLRWLFPEMKRAITLSKDSIEVWDIERGEVVTTLLLGKHWIAGRTSKGLRATLWTQHNTIQVWDIEQGKLVAMLEYDTSRLKEVESLSNGRRAILTSWNKSIQIWDIEQGRVTATLEKYERGSYVSFSPDGLWATLWSPQDETYIFYDLLHGRVISSFKEKRGIFDEVILIPDKSYAIFWSRHSRTLKVRDLGQGKVITILESKAMWLETLEVALDGQYAILWSNNGAAQIWEIDHWRVTTMLSGGAGKVSYVAFTSLGRRAVSWSRQGRIVQIWDLAQGRVIVTQGMAVGVDYSMFLTPDARHIIFLSLDHSFEVWELDRGQVISTGKVDELRFEDIGLLQERYPEISELENKTIEIWDMESRRIISSVKEDALWLHGVELASNGRYAIGWSLLDNSIQVWDIESRELIIAGESIFIIGGGSLPELDYNQKLPLRKRKAISQRAGRAHLWDIEHEQFMSIPERDEIALNKIELTPDGRYAIVWSWDGATQIWNVNEGKVTNAPVLQLKKVSFTVPMPDARHVIFWLMDNSILIWDLEQGKMISAYEHQVKGVSCVALTQDGTRAITSSMDDTVRIWDLSDGKVIMSLEGHTTAVIDAIVVTPDGRHAISATEDDDSALVEDGDTTFIVWNIEQGTAIRRRQGRGGPIVIAPDGHTIISCLGSYAQTYDLEHDTVHLLGGHSRRVTAVAITHDGGHVITGSADNEIKVWDLKSRTELVTLNGHTDSIRSIAVTPDDFYVISGSADETLKIWDIRQGTCLATFSGQGPYSRCCVNPDGSIIIATDVLGQVYFYSLENAVHGPSIVTAWLNREESIIAFGCPICRTWSELPASALGTELRCPNCGASIKLNSFTVNADWRPVAKAWKGEK